MRTTALDTHSFAGRARRALTTAFAGVLLLAAPLACFGREEGNLRYRMPKDPPTLDPFRSADENTGLYAFNIFDGMVEFAPGSLEIVPAVAESWTISPDGRTYTFKLRKGVRFHNGREVTGADVVYSLRRGLSPKKGSVVVPLIDSIEGAQEFSTGKSAELPGVSSPNPGTVVIRLERPFTPFLAALASVAGSILPPEVYEDPNEAYLAHPVGCGPFRFESWDRGISIKLAAFPDHWKGRPSLSGIEVRFLPDASTALEEFKAGNLDFDNEAPPGRRAWVRENLKSSYLTWRRVATSFIGINFMREPLKSNLKLRQAMNYAIDRERIAKVLQEGKDVATSRVTPPGLLGHNPAEGPFRYDPERAKALLAEAGYPGGKGLPEMVYLTQNNEAIRRYSEAVQADLAAIGLKVRINSMDFGGYIKGLYGTKEGGADGSIFNFLWYPDLPDPDAFIRVLFHSPTADDIADNFERYSNPEVDRLLDEGRAEIDTAKRESIYRKAEDLILADAGCIPIYFQFEDALIGPRVKGFVPNPLGDFASHLELVSLGP